MNITAMLESDAFSYAKSEAIPDQTDNDYIEFTL